MRTALRLLVLLLLTLGLASCTGPTATSIHRAGQARLNARWVVLPIENHSETPQAGERVEAMLDTLLRKDGVVALEKYPPQKDDDTHLLTSDRQRYETALAWAKEAKYEFAVTGSVEEWRYKSGIDAEPAIGVSIRVLDLTTGKVIWVGTGSKTGAANDNTTLTALKLLDEMMRELASPTQ
jgi:hypothetical protein